MTRDEACRRLIEMTTALTGAAMLIKSETEMIERYLEEARSMDSIGPIIDPTLFNSSERRATDAIIRPLVVAARDYLHAYETIVGAAADALGRVKP